MTEAEEQNSPVLMKKIELQQARQAILQARAKRADSLTNIEVPPQVTHVTAQTSVSDTYYIPELPTGDLLPPRHGQSQLPPRLDPNLPDITSNHSKQLQQPPSLPPSLPPSSLAPLPPASSQQAPALPPFPYQASTQPDAPETQASLRTPPQAPPPPPQFKKASQKAPQKASPVKQPINRSALKPATREIIGDGPQLTLSQEIRHKLGLPSRPNQGLPPAPDQSFSQNSSGGSTQPVSQHPPHQPSSQRSTHQSSLQQPHQPSPQPPSAHQSTQTSHSRALPPIEPSARALRESGSADSATSKSVPGKNSAQSTDPYTNFPPKQPSQSSLLQATIDIQHEDSQEYNRSQEFSTQNIGKAAKLNAIQTSEIIKLNIGGTRFATSLKTLLNDPNSLFVDILQCSGKQRDEKGYIFIDRDPSHFQVILNFLRNMNQKSDVVLPSQNQARRELLLEAEFYCLQGLQAMIHNEMQ